MKKREQDLQAEGRVSRFVRTLALAVIAGSAALPAAAEQAGDFYYGVNGDTQITITGYAGAGGTLVIPAEIAGLPVTRIGAHAFRDLSELTGALVIPDGVAEIGAYAFYNCSNLTSLVIGKGVVTIEDRTFAHCAGLKSLVIGSGVTSIEDYAFELCVGLTGGLVIPDGVTSIGSAAFHTCSNLTSLVIGSGVASIGRGAFSGCSGLTGELALPDGLREIEPWVFAFCSGLTGTLTIPDSVGHIGATAFAGCVGLTGTLVIPAATTNIDDGAFENCPGLSDLVLGNGVKRIGVQAFGRCGGLAGTLSVPGNVTDVGDYAFVNCGALTGVTFGLGVTRIGSYAFLNCPELTGVLVIPDSVTEIGVSAFIDCAKLTGVTLGNQVARIGVGGFSGCGGLTGTLTIPDSVTEFGNYAFASCSNLTGLVFGKGLASVPSQSFTGCSSLSGTLVFPDSVTSIGEQAFYGCASLAELVLGAGITNLGNYAFAECIGLTGIFAKGDAPALGGPDVFLDDTARVSYVEGLAGWGSAFGELPTTPWTSKVTFNAQGGAAPSFNGFFYKVGHPYGTLPVTSRTDYDFLGWWTEAGGMGTLVATSTTVPYLTGEHTLFAKWRLHNTFAVTFDAQGGTAPVPPEKTVALGSAYGTLATTERAGHTFGGWWTGAGGAGSQVTAATAMVTPADHTLYAKWTANACTVTFDAQGGTAPLPSAKTVTFGAAYGALATTERAGHAFGGWWTEAGGAGSQVTDATVVVTAADHTLYARWTANAYTVTFDAQGGTAPVPPAETVTFGAAYGALATTERAGHTFGGWWTGAGGAGSQVTERTTVTTAGAHTLYARWTANAYTVTFDAQGGSAPSPATKSVTYASAYGSLASTERAGHTFGGWWTEANGAGSQVTDATAVVTAADHTLYARWTANAYTVTFDAQGGSAPSPAAKSVTYASAYGALAFTERAGHTFGGWWTGAGGAGTLVTDATAVATAAAHTLYARWTVNAYTVTFDAQGGTVSPQQKAVTYDAAYGALPVPARTDYAFTGWWTGLGGAATRVNEGTPVTTASDHTLYAAWRKLPVMTGMAFGMALPDAFGDAAKITVKGLPAGLKYNPKTGRIEGVPTKAGTYTVTISATGVTPQALTLTVEALPAWAQGAFNGTVAGGGLASMTVTALGKVTGKIAAGGTNYTFTALSYAAGGSPEDGFAIAAVAKAGKAALPLTLAVTQAAGMPSLAVAAGELALAGGRGVALWRDAWKSEAAALAPYIGYHTATLPGNDECGSGYLTFTVDKAGKVKVGGKLADGTAVSLGGTLILDEAGRVFAVVYTSPAIYKGGCLFGLAELVDPTAGEVYLRPLDGVPFLWQSRSPQATEVLGEGFARATGLSGGWYSKTANLAAYYAGKNLAAGVDPDASEPELAVGAVRYDAIWWDPTGIALTPTLKSGVMAGLAAPAAGKPVDPDKDGVWDYGAANSVGLKISLARPTGIFKGSFKAWFDYPVKKHVSKTLKFEGALTPVREDPLDGVEGRGFFLWPDKAVPPLPAKPYAFSWSYDFLVLSGAGNVSED